MTMCGRFVGTYRVVDLLEELGEAVEDAGLVLRLPDTEEYLLRNFNVAPTTAVPVLMNRGGAIELEIMQWGLVPSWSKDPRVGAKMINARAETLTEKVSFKNLVRSNRCIIPMSGFYEWHREGERPKVPFYVTRGDHKLLLTAGIWTTSAVVDNGFTCAMVTRESGDDLASLHHRSPAHFSAELACEWMTAEMELMQLGDNSVQPKLSFHEVSTDVNSVRNNRAELIEETINEVSAPESDHPRLF
jgi:putative SOS response-associated peptidase YedK